MKRVIIAVVVVVAVVVVGVLSQLRNRDEAASEVSTTPAASASASPTPAASSSPAQSSHDHDHEDSAPSSSSTPSEGVDPDETPIATPSYDGQQSDDSLLEDPQEQKKVLAAGKQFATAWLDPDPARRVAGIKPVATQDLTKKLSDPGIRTLNTRITGEPKLIKDLGFQAIVQQRLEDGRGLDMLLTYTPGEKYEWLVIDIEPSLS